MEANRFFSRDLSWVHFNGRVLEEAAREQVPLLERINFLGIFSSNLDEFYRVRIPVLKALQKIKEKKADTEAAYVSSLNELQQVTQTIYEQQLRYGEILARQLIPGLRAHQIRLLYNAPIPAFLQQETRHYFLTEILAFLQLVALDEHTKFFPQNNRLYFVVQLQDEITQSEKLMLLNIPSNEVPRFYLAKTGDEKYVVFVDDIIREQLNHLFPQTTILGCYSFKVTRDAELDLGDEYAGDIADQIEKQLNKRDKGLATRFLYDAQMPLRLLQWISELLGLQNATTMPGGRYHNLKDFSSFPVSQPAVSYAGWPAIHLAGVDAAPSLASIIDKQDLLIHTPYESYDTILRFFNEAAIHPDVEEINVTLYRVASNSRIVNALISAAQNGKKVQVVVELKARFDEANNLKWAKKMKQAGVKIIYSITALKVHAKIALVKTRKDGRLHYAGLLSTGNLNESTARFYTDHILLTTRHELLREMELLFIFMAKRQEPSQSTSIPFTHLLVAQFNLQSTFLSLIDAEIAYARQGLPARLVLKMNNLEEKTLISKLYEASQAGVQITLIIRSICCLIPGIKGMSEKITIRRIVDRYLEHGRVFIFHNNGDTKVFLGSADWMNRNIYRRIEVCFPVEDAKLKAEIETLIRFQLEDNTQAVLLDEHLQNVSPKSVAPFLQSQLEIYSYLKSKA